MIFANNNVMKKIGKMGFKNENWKAKGQKYLKELQVFLDKADNIENEELKKEIIFQMLKCDKELTILAEEKFKDYYLQNASDIKEDNRDDDD